VAGKFEGDGGKVFQNAKYGMDRWVIVAGRMPGPRKNGSRESNAFGIQKNKNGQKASQRWGHPGHPRVPDNLGFLSQKWHYKNFGQISFQLVDGTRGKVNGSH